jgi:cobyrinic acid a,c-diamide synthase
VNDNLLTGRGAVIHGNDFRFSRIVNVHRDARFAYRMRIGRGIDGEHEGLMEHNTLAVIGFIYFAFDTRLAENFVKHAEEYRRR